MAAGTDFETKINKILFCFFRSFMTSKLPGLYIWVEFCNTKKGWKIQNVPWHALKKNWKHFFCFLQVSWPHQKMLNCWVEILQYKKKLAIGQYFNISVQTQIRWYIKDVFSTLYLIFNLNYYLGWESSIQQYGTNHANCTAATTCICVLFYLFYWEMFFFHLSVEDAENPVAQVSHFN
jgi:hypothetical protein